MPEQGTGLEQNRLEQTGVGINQPGRSGPGRVGPGRSGPERAGPERVAEADGLAGGAGKGGRGGLGPAMRKETILLASCILLLLLAIIPPLINLGRYQRRIATAISRSIGRPVSTDAIALRLLPWPAFAISNLTVGEDPGFGAEPALMAPEVVIEPRLSSLWRGRLELSRVELTDASVNLVRRGDGRWNISSVLLQASHLENAPTAQTRPGPEPRFPYIEATGTRINFKREDEKLPYSLLNADFSMWLARPGAWQLKLEGQPVRTDLDLALGDTGLLHIEGELQRASALGAMPLHLSGEWSHAPLGQLSRLLLGSDRGWRGDIDVAGQVRGAIDHLDLHTHVVIVNLHRQEFTPDQPFDVDATCDGLYSRSQPQRSQSPADALRCRWPVGAGALVLEARAKETGHQVELTADKVPAAFIASVISLATPRTTAAEALTGELSGSFGYDSVADTGPGAFSGAASMPELSIANAGADGAALVLHDVAVHAEPGPVPAFAIEAAPVDLGVPGAPLTLAAELSRQGYLLHASGGATLPALAAAAHAVRLPTVSTFASGTGAATAQLALTTSGTWMGEEAADRPFARAIGSLRFENVRWSPPWLAVPVRFAALSASFSPGMIRWSTPSAAISTGPTALHFAAEALAPVACVPPQDCRVQVSLRTGSLDAGTLEAAMLSDHRVLLSGLLDRIGGEGQPAAALPQAAGTIHAGVLTLGRLAMRNVSAVWATSGTARPVFRMQSLDGQALGGSVHLQGTVEPSHAGPQYAVRLLVSGVSAVQTAQLWHESWGPGTLGGTAVFTLAGSTEADLLQSMQGTFHASWTHGSLEPVLPHFASWDGMGTFGPGGLNLVRSTLSGTPETLAGSIGWDRTLHLELADPNATPTTLSGTLAAPAGN